MLWHYCTCAITIPVKGASEEDAAFLGRMIEWDSHNHIILTWIRNTSISTSPICWAVLMIQNQYVGQKVLHYSRIHEISVSG